MMNQLQKIGITGALLLLVFSTNAQTINVMS